MYSFILFLFDFFNNLWYNTEYKFKREYRLIISIMVMIMKKENSNYLNTLESVIQKLNSQIAYSFSRGKSCSLYIAIFDKATNCELFLNDSLIFSGSETICKKIFKDILKKLKKEHYYLDGNLTDVAYIKYMKEAKALNLV